MRDPAPKKKQTRGPKKQKQPENYTHWPFLEYTSSPEKNDGREHTPPSQDTDSIEKSPDNDENMMDVAIKRRRGRPSGSSTKKKKKQ